MGASHPYIIPSYFIKTCSTLTVRNDAGTYAFLPLAYLRITLSSPDGASHVWNRSDISGCYEDSWFFVNPIPPRGKFPISPKNRATN
jgi:hypothetical protein